MKIKHLTIASLIGALGLAASAQAVVIAGWDFSQFKVPGDATGGSSPLAATNASLDPNGAGIESGFIGQATFSNADLLPTAGLGGNCERTGSAGTSGCATPNVDGPVRSNRSEPFDLGLPSFDAFSILKSEGQTWTSRTGVTATAPVDVVFRAAAGYTGGANAWKVSFGGRMLTGTASTVDVAFSSNGTSFTNYGTVNLTADDERYEVALDPAAYPTGYVRLSLNAASGQPVIDNVAVEATPIPEPAAVAQLLSGVACMLGLARLRK
jgi:hypothetical protein